MMRVLDAKTERLSSSMCTKWYFVTVNVVVAHLENC